MTRRRTLTALALTGLALPVAALVRHYPVTTGRESRFAACWALVVAGWAEHDPAEVGP